VDSGLPRLLIEDAVEGRGIVGREQALAFQGLDRVRILSHFLD
jgi:hypothetical protein